MSESPVPFTRDQLVALSSRRTLDRALAEHLLVRILPGIYVAHRHRDHARVRTLAVARWMPKPALISGASALHLMDSSYPEPSRVSVVVPYGMRLRAPGWVQTRSINPVVSRRLVQGVRCVPPEFAVIDGWRRAPQRDRAGLFYEALWRRMVSPDSVADTLAAVPRVTGRRELEHLLDECSFGATTPLEVYARRYVFTGSAFRDFEWQAPVVARGINRRIDVLHRHAGVAVELDGARYHSGESQRLRDIERDAELASAGIMTIRLTFQDLRARPAWCREHVLNAVNTRLARPGRA
ncbi:MAG: hypothetical protein WDZ57_00840 [Demequina sp.]